MVVVCEVAVLVEPSECVCVCVCVCRFARVFKAETKNAEIRVCVCVCVCVCVWPGGRPNPFFRGEMARGSPQLFFEG